MWIDWAKSLCMFLVVLGHCHIAPSMQMVTQTIYSFHIPQFFFLSGMLCTRAFSWRGFFRDVRYMLLPYYVYGLMQVTVHCFLSRTFSFNFVLSEVCTLLWANDASIGAIWFLPALFICKQLFFLLRWLRTLIRPCSARWTVVVFIFLLSLMLPHFISSLGIGLPLFSDSALFGLPFFIVGSRSLVFIECRIAHPDGQVASPTRLVYLSLIAAGFLVLTVIQSLHNGFVSIAVCSYGSSLFLYYVNALTGMAAVVVTSVLLSRISRGAVQSFVTQTSWGTIVTLGFHGTILLILQYYLPVSMGYYSPTADLPVAILYALVTYIICYAIILWGGRYCPGLLGLKR